MERVREREKRQEMNVKFVDVKQQVQMGDFIWLRLFRTKIANTD